MNGLLQEVEEGLVLVEERSRVSPAVLLLLALLSELPRKLRGGRIWHCQCPDPAGMAGGGEINQSYHDVSDPLAVIWHKWFTISLEISFSLLLRLLP